MVSRVSVSAARTADRNFGLVAEAEECMRQLQQVTVELAVAAGTHSDVQAVRDI